MLPLSMFALVLSLGLYVARAASTLISKAIQKNITDAELKWCKLHAAEDMPYLSARFGKDGLLSPQLGTECMRAAEQLYCEAVLDFAEP
eukprot:968778-Amphidinium_carterae.1